MFRLNKKQITGLTLIEVLVSLAIISAVFVFIINATFEGLKKTKTLELQDQMLNYASEAVQILRLEQAKGWEDVSTTLSSGRAFIAYDESRSATVTSIGGQNGTAVSPGCILRSDQFSKVSAFPSFAECSALSVEAPGKEALFGRFILATSRGTTAGETDAYEVRVIVACFADQCDSTTFKPIELTTYLYKTISQ